MQRTASWARNRLRLGLPTTAFACVMVAAALAATSYSVHVSAPKSVKRSSPFRVRLSGSAKVGSGLQVYLDHRKCAASERKEAQQDQVYHSGYPYFILIGGGPPGPVGPVKTTSTGFGLSGAFKKTPSAHAGTITGTEYVCAYVDETVPTGQTFTRARASATYQVTK